MPLHGGCQLVFMFEECKVVLLNCFALIEARLLYDLCHHYFHTYDPPGNVLRNLCQGYTTSKLLVSFVFSDYWSILLRPNTSFRKEAEVWGPEGGHPKCLCSQVSLMMR
jgi:hypothetical protein